MRTEDSSRSAAASMRPVMGEGEPLIPLRTVSIILTQLLHVIPAMDCMFVCVLYDVFVCLFVCSFVCRFV